MTKPLPPSPAPWTVDQIAPGHCVIRDADGKRIGKVKRNADANIIVKAVNAFAWSAALEKVFEE